MLLLVTHSCAPDTSRLIDQMSPASLRRKLWQTEGLRPGEYLPVAGTCRWNLLDRLVLEGLVPAAAYEGGGLPVNWLARPGKCLLRSAPDLRSP